MIRGGVGGKLFSGFFKVFAPMSKVAYIVANGIETNFGAYFVG